MILVLSPLIVGFGVYLMVTGRIGRGPMPIEGGLAVALGAVMAGFGAIFFDLAWTARRPED